MSFADDLANEIKKSAAGHCCTAGRWYAALDTEGRAAFDDCVANGSKGYKILLYRMMARNGFDGSYRTLCNHLMEH